MNGVCVCLYVCTAEVCGDNLWGCRAPVTYRTAPSRRWSHSLFFYCPVGLTRFIQHPVPVRALLGLLWDALVCLCVCLCVC